MSTGNGNGRENVIVFGAHPDDGEIGAGGTIAAYAAMGHRAVLTHFRVPGGHDDTCHHTRQRRHTEAQRAAEALGAELLGFGLTREEIQPSAHLVGVIDQLLEQIQPTAIFTHWVGDSHPEHLALTRAVLAATTRSESPFRSSKSSTQMSVVPVKGVGVNVGGRGVGEGPAVGVPASETRPIKYSSPSMTDGLPSAHRSWVACRGFRRRIERAREFAPADTRSRGHQLPACP